MIPPNRWAQTTQTVKNYNAYPEYKFLEVIFSILRDAGLTRASRHLVLTCLKVRNFL